MYYVKGGEEMKGVITSITELDGKPKMKEWVGLEVELDLDYTKVAERGVFHVVAENHGTIVTSKLKNVVAGVGQYEFHSTNSIYTIKKIM